MKMNSKHKDSVLTNYTSSDDLYGTFRDDNSVKNPYHQMSRFESAKESMRNVFARTNVRVVGGIVILALIIVAVSIRSSSSSSQDTSDDNNQFGTRVQGVLGKAQVGKPQLDNSGGSAGTDVEELLKGIKAEATSTNTLLNNIKTSDGDAASTLADILDAANDQKTTLSQIATNTGTFVSWGELLSVGQADALPSLNIRYDCPITDFCKIPATSLKYSASSDAGGYIIWSPDATDLSGETTCFWYSFSMPLYMPDEICTEDEVSGVMSFVTSPPFNFNDRLKVTTVVATTQGMAADFCTKQVSDSMFNAYYQNSKYWIYSGTSHYYFHFRPFFYYYGDCDVIGVQDTS